VARPSLTADKRSGRPPNMPLSYASCGASPRMALGVAHARALLVGRERDSAPTLGSGARRTVCWPRLEMASAPAPTWGARDGRPLATRRELRSSRGRTASVA